ncbi:hypothetical protein T310_7695, partial [Rasamsonia emersonii CBS 393.64]
NTNKPKINAGRSFTSNSRLLSTNPGRWDNGRDEPVRSEAEAGREAGRLPASHALTDAVDAFHFSILINSAGNRGWSGSRFKVLHLPLAVRQVDSERLKKRARQFGRSSLCTEGHGLASFTAIRIWDFLAPWQGLFFCRWDSYNNGIYRLTFLSSLPFPFCRVLFLVSSRWRISTRASSRNFGGRRLR